MEISELFPIAYFTNMDYNQSKAENTTREVEKIGITPTRIAGVVYTGTSNHEWNGWIGCGLAHLNGLRLAKELNQNVLMFEDDVVFVDDYIKIIHNAVNELPENWDMFYLGANITGTVHQVSSQLGRLTSARATHAYGVNHNFISKLIETVEAKAESKPIDCVYADEVCPSNYCYVTIPLVAMQRDGYSDISSTTVSYAPWMNQRFNENLIRM